MFTGSTSLNLDCEIDTRWSIKSEGSCYLLEIKLVYIEDVSLLMTGVCLKVGAIAILGSTVEVIVALDKLHELLLYVG